MLITVFRYLTFRYDKITKNSFRGFLFYFDSLILTIGRTFLGAIKRHVRLRRIYSINPPGRPCTRARRPENCVENMESIVRETVSQVLS